MAAATDPYASLLADLAIPHRAKAACRELLRHGPGAMPAVRRGLRHANAQVRAAVEAAMKVDPSPAVRKKAAWYAPGGAIYRRTAP